MTPPDGAPSRRDLGASLQWVLLAVLLGYTALVHHGIGPVRTTVGQPWYEPRNFLDDFEVLLPVLETTGRAVIGLTLPAVLLAIAIFLAGRSAVARALALSCCFGVALFVYYGVQATDVWRFFHWRASAVLAVLALSAGFATGAPLLAASWLRLSWPLRVASYAPVALLVIAFIRNATGTDPSLQYAISPWPAVSVFGIEVAALFVFAVLLGVALGAAGVATARAGGASPASGAAGVALGLALPVILLAAGSWLGLLPFKLGPRIAMAIAVCATLAMVGVLTLRVAGADGLRHRALGLGAGAALLGAPLVTGQAWARFDYYVAREHQARQVIDALEAYLDAEELYPDELEHLIPDYIEAIPEPAIGFSFLYDGSFRYRSFGSSFILEFPATRWVECAYTPPYDDEEGEENGDAASDTNGFEDDSLGEAWSCPSRPPELW